MPKNLKELSQKAHEIYEKMENARIGNLIGLRRRKISQLANLKKLADENKDEKEIADEIFKLDAALNPLKPANDSDKLPNDNKPFENNDSKLQNIVKILRKCADIYLTKTNITEAEQFIIKLKDYKDEPEFQANYLQFANDALLFINPKNPKSISTKPEEQKAEHETSAKETRTVDPGDKEKLSKNYQSIVDNLQTDISTHINKIKTLEEKIKELTDTLSAKDKKNLEQQVEISKLKNKLATGTKKFSEEVSSATEELAALKKQFDGFTKAIDELKAENDKLKNDLETEKGKHSYASKVKAGQPSFYRQKPI